MGEEIERVGQKARPAVKGLSHQTKAFASEVYAAVRSGELANRSPGKQPSASVRGVQNVIRRRVSTPIGVRNY